MNITKEQLILILPQSKPVADTYLPYLAEAIDRGKLNTAIKLSSFLSQTGHESGQFTQTVENLNYSAQALLDKWPHRVVNQAMANSIARKPEQIANIVYSGLNGNGDTRSGDGWRFRGRGLIQITFRHNYLLAGRWIGTDLCLDPDSVAQPHNAMLTALWYWSVNDLNRIAETKGNTAVGGLVNRGSVSKIAANEDDRLAIYTRALKVLS